MKYVVSEAFSDPVFWQGKHLTRWAIGYRYSQSLESGNQIDYILRLGCMMWFLKHDMWAPSLHFLNTVLYSICSIMARFQIRP